MIGSGYDKKELCAICGFPSDELNGEGECPGCVDEYEEEMYEQENEDEN